MEHSLTLADLWLAIIGGAFVIVAVIVGVQYTFHRQNRVDIEKQRKIEEKRNEQLDFVLNEHSPHSHVEPDGAPLTESGIRYPRANRLQGS